MNSALFLAAQVRALKAVESPSYEDTFRRIQRWYSEKYHVDITRMDTIPDEEVLQAWFEDRFLALKNSPDEKANEEYETLKRSILHRDDEAKEESEDDDWERKMLEEIRQQNGMVAPEPKSPESPNLSGDTPDHVELSGADDYYVPDE